MRNSYSPEFKAKVVREVLREEEVAQPGRGNLRCRQGRFQRGIEARLRQSRFPWNKTLEQFDFDFQPSLDRRQVRELAGLSFVERAHNVVVLGPPGVGKTIWRSLSASKRSSRLFGAVSHLRKPHDPA